MSIGDITLAELQKATAEDDIHVAARNLQIIGDIKSGDVAGICLDEGKWLPASPHDRMNMLLNWLLVEQNYEGD